MSSAKRIGGEIYEASDQNSGSLIYRQTVCNQWVNRWQPVSSPIAVANNAATINGRPADLSSQQQPTFRFEGFTVDDGVSNHLQQPEGFFIDQPKPKDVGKNNFFRTTSTDPFSLIESASNGVRDMDVLTKPQHLALRPTASTNYRHNAGAAHHSRSQSRGLNRLPVPSMPMHTPLADRERQPLTELGKVTSRQNEINQSHRSSRLVSRHKVTTVRNHQVSYDPIGKSRGERNNYFNKGEKNNRMYAAETPDNRRQLIKGALGQHQDAVVDSLSIAGRVIANHNTDDRGNGQNIVINIHVNCKCRCFAK